jgi:hypothetical protein
MGIKFAANDPVGRTVTCDEDWWRIHIELRRPELAGQHEAVAAAVREPNAEYGDPRRPNRRLFYALGALRRFPRLYVKVVVDYSDLNPGGAGHFVTAYLVRQIDRGEELVRIWKL